MKWSASLWWKAFAKDRRRSHADEDDRAGMGTAFGLDASLPTLPMHEDGLDPPASATVRPDSTPWAHRLTRRSAL
jgi:hypothetical protein